MDLAGVPLWRFKLNNAEDREIFLAIRLAIIDINAMHRVDIDTLSVLAIGRYQNYMNMARLVNRQAVKPFYSLPIIKPGREGDFYCEGHEES